MKNKTTLLVLFLLILTQSIFAQKQFNTWYFGNKASLNFNVLAGEFPNANYGTNLNNFSANPAVWSDSDGNINFYSDGNNVYNSMNSVDIADLGGSSASQPVLIVPKPNYPNNFYIITSPTPSAVGSEIHYQEVIYDGAMGYVMSQGSQTIMTNAGAGKIAAISNEDKSKYWVVTHQLNTDAFEVHSFSESGHSGSINYSLEPTYGNHLTETNIFGFMKFSPKGNYLAVSSDNLVGGRVDIYNFDKELGELSFNSTYSITAAYGIEFSPEEDFLYVGQNKISDSKLYQIDIDGGTIIEVGVMADSNRHIGALQLGPDGRIYVAHNKTAADNDFLGVINYPNQPGAVCDFNKQAIPIGNSNNAVNMSLPSMPADLVLPKLPIDFMVVGGNCAGEETVFQITGDMTNVTSVEWYFDDVNSPNDYSDEIDPAYTFWSGGTHLVELTVWEGGTPTYIQHDIVITGPHINSFLEPADNCGEVTLYPDFTGTPPYDYTWTNTTTLDGGLDDHFIVNNIGDNYIYLAIEDNTGCTAQYTETVYVEELPTLTFDPANFEACDQTTLSPAFDDSNEPFIYWTLDGGAAIEGTTFTITTTGVHTVEAEISVSGCNNIYTETVTVNQSPILDIGNNISACDEIILDANDMILTANNPTFSWLNQNTTDTGTGQTFDVNNLGENIVELTVTDQNNCSSTESYTVYIDESPTLTFSQSFEDCDEVILEPSYTSDNTPSFEWQTLPATVGSYSETFTINTPGTYSVVATIRDTENSCSNIYTETVTVNESPILDIGNNISACDEIILDGNDMILIANNPTFSWLNQNTTDTGTGQTFDVNNLGENIVELTVTDENDCFATESYTVYVNQSPNIDLGEDIECATEVVELSIPTDDYQSIFWSNPIFNETYSCTVIEAGEYWVEVKDNNNCTATDTIQIDFAECQPFDLSTTINTVDVANQYLNCQGDKSINLSTNPVFLNNNQCYTQDVGTTQFFWEMGDGELINEQNPTYTYSNYGTYVITLVAIDNQNCKSHKNIIVDISDNPFVSATDKVACEGETIDIVAGREGEGNDLDIVVDFFDVTYPLYEVYYQTALIPDNTDDYVSTISIYDDNNYIIENASDISSFFVKMEHSDITNFNDFKIVCPTGLETTLMNTSLASKQIIAGEPILFDYDDPQLGNGYTYFWSDASTVTVSDLIASGLPIKNYTDPNNNEYGYVEYLPQRTYKPYDNFAGLVGCPINGDWKLVINDAVSQDNGFVIEWGVTFSSGNLFKQLDIDDGGWTGDNIIATPNDSTITVNALNPGNSIYTLSLTDSYGCSNSQNINLFTESINLELGNDTTICFNQDIELNADAGNIGNFNYQWNNGETNPVINVLESGTYSVTVTGEACEESDFIIINVAPEIVADLGDDLSLCFNKNLELNPNTTTSDFTYNWSTNETTETITVSEGGEYWVEVRKENCKNSDTIYVKAIPELKAYLGNDTTICEGQNLPISPETTENVFFNWSNGETTPHINVNETGEYWVEINQEGCTNIDTIKIDIAPAINLELGDDITIITGNQITLDTKIEDAIYFWQPTEETTQSINVSQAGMYVVTVTKGCTASDSITVYVDDVQLIIPNTFTPNGDGINDTWKFGNADNLGEIEINIFDRLGNIMTNYTTTENPTGWDGTKNSNPLPSDTFWYIIKFKDGTTKSGTVTIRR